MNKKLISYSLFFFFNSLFAHTVLEFCEVRDRGALAKLFMKRVKNIFKINQFIETGTWGGATTINAAQVFAQVDTIELSQEFYKNNVPKFAMFPNICAYLGESSAILSKIVPQLITSRCVFYLDAHFSGGNTARGDENTPLLKEIAIIGDHLKSSLILIDDIRLCQPNRSTIEQHIRLHPEDANVDGYPTLTQIKNILQKINPNYVFVVWGDVGFAFAKDIYPDIDISPTLYGLTVSRMFEETAEHTAQETTKLLEAERYIMRATGEEKRAIELLIQAPENRYLPDTFTTHYRLWNALVCMGNNKYQQAKQLLLKIIDLGFTHWRAQWYLAIALHNLQEHEASKALVSQIEHHLTSLNIPYTNMTAMV